MTVVANTQWPARVLPRKPERRSVTAVLALWRKRCADRRVLYDLALYQPDSVLLDAQVTREAALRESRKPFWRG